MIKMSEYATRRKALMQKIGASGVAILPAAPEIIRNGDTTYPYRQNSDFYYLTGFDEPEAVVVLLPKRKEGEYILFNRVRDRSMEIWDGPRAGQKGACKYFLADDAYPIGELQQKLPELLMGRDTIHYPLGRNKWFDKILFSTLKTIRTKIRSGVAAPSTLVDIAPTLHEMRLFKSPAEIAVMKRAADISAKAHVRAMQACQPGMHEFELEGELCYEFLKQGARTVAYPSIVAAGKNTCVLHYIKNNAKIKNGDLVLIDAGCEYQEYASDITRTFPANGKFSAEQRAIYELVLEAQLAAIKSIKPGVPYNHPQNVVVKTITQGLIDLGLLKGKLSTLIEKEAYFPFYMHRHGHWLGLDVHDVGSYKIKDKWRPLAANQVLTVEPGIYISADIPGVPKRWHNIGVRIEDDVLVTKSGCEILSNKVPKKIAEIEAIMKS